MITPRSQDFSQWYQDLVLQARMADYSPVKGCMVIRPNGYAIWERIQAELDRRIKETGTQNCYFPMFIPESFLKKEAEHVEGFAPELAIVTHAGGKKLEESLVVRPTSETIINSMFAKWIQSYRDLPFLVNQWANVVRWEMRTRLFLRTTEFLWQEGHTCHATDEDAESMARQMLQVYSEFAENVLAMPVFSGRKSESERFAGAVRTYCIEAMMQDKKALQAGTSHHLGQNFAQAFGTQFLDKDSKQKFVHQTSWGVSTRLIGGVVMTHSDDKGLVLPPRVAHTHIVIIPIFRDEAAKVKVLEACQLLARQIQDAKEVKDLGYRVVIKVDDDETKQPGWKYHEAELVGIPLRIELGPKDLEKQSVVMVRRDQGKKEFVPMNEAPARVARELSQMQRDLLSKARAFRDENTHRIQTFAELKEKIEQPGGFFIAPWDGTRETEAKIKEELKATIRCLPLDANFQPLPGEGPCLLTGARETVTAIFARNY